MQNRPDPSTVAGRDTPDLRSLGKSDLVISYTPNTEDIRLLRVFRDVEDGFYVDVGAGHPTGGSVTRLFYDRGWSGINVEPGPHYELLCVERPRDVNVHGAVGATDGSTSFFVTYPEYGMSTVDLMAHAEAADAYERVEEVSVPQYRLQTLLWQHAAGRTIHFLKVDVEGAERQVLESSDWTTFRPIVAVVEAVESWSTVPTHERWEDVLVDADYAFAAFDGINRYYVDRAHDELIPLLAYPVSALDRFVAASSHEAEVEYLTAERDELRRENARLRDDLADVYASRTWQAGRMVARAGAPAASVARLLRRRRRRRPPSTTVELLTPKRAYAQATARGEPWHFARSGQRTHRRGDALVGLERMLGPAGRPLDGARAAKIRHALDRLEAPDALTWEDRRVLLDLDALIRLVERSGTDAGGSSRSRPAHSASVVVDARCLQDPDLRGQGVGMHARTALAATREATRGIALVLLTAADLPDLDPSVAGLADRFECTPWAAGIADAVLFVQLSPMTASTAPATPFLLSAACRTAAAVYDFIPSEFPPAYLKTPRAALANRIRLETLRHYDQLLPISEATAAACERVLGTHPPLTVTGVADPLTDVEPAMLPSSDGPFMLVPAGRDPRKNAAAAVAALAEHIAAGAAPLSAVVTGNLTLPQERALQQLAARVGLPEDAVQLRGRVGPRELRALYSSAELVFVGSFAEGFSIPVVEAVRNGAPVVGSDLDAHRELIGQGPWLGRPDDIVSLAGAIATVRDDRAAVAERQRASLGDGGDPSRAWETFGDAVRTLLVGHRPQRPKPPAPSPAAARPRIAVVSPLPPARTGVADYTEFTFRQVAEYADVAFFSTGGTPDTSFAARRASSAPYLEGDFDSVVLVAGNSHFHGAALDLLEAFGGACIAHDPSMVESYGADRGAEWVASVLWRDRSSVRADELADLVADPGRLPSIGYDLLARQASPLIVHGDALATRIEAETGVTPAVVPFVPYNVPFHDTIDDAVRAAARAAVGFSDDAFHVATFGIVDRRLKGHELIVGAAGWLKLWGAPIRLHMVGAAPPGERDELEQVARELGVSDSVVWHDHVDRGTLDQLLLATDVAVQLRTTSVHTLSGGLADCLAYGIPTVTTDALARELDAPSYVGELNPSTSTLLLAEAVEALRDTRRSGPAAIEDERHAFLSRRSVDGYARALLEALGLGVA